MVLARQHRVAPLVFQGGSCGCYEKAHAHALVVHSATAACAPSIIPTAAATAKHSTERKPPDWRTAAKLEGLAASGQTLGATRVQHVESELI
jgi:uncharacterized membrane protein YfcA